MENAFLMCHQNRLEWRFENEEDVYEWCERMKKDGEYGDEISLQIARYTFS